MNLVGSLDRFLNWVSRHSTAALAFVGTLVTALGAAFGPAWVEEVKERVEKQRARSELVTRVVDATANLDPADPKTILRFGIVADLVQDNKGVFDLRIDLATARLKQLSEDLRRGSPSGVLDGSIERKEKELRQLVDSSQSIRAEVARLKLEFDVSATANSNANSGSNSGAAANAHAVDGDPEPGGKDVTEPSRQALVTALESIAARQEALIKELQAARDDEQQARSDFVKGIEDATRKRQEADKLMTTLNELKKGLSNQVDSQRALSAQLESAKVGLAETIQAVGGRLRTDVNALASERNVLRQQGQALAKRTTELESRESELNAQIARLSQLSCERSDLDRLLLELRGMPVRVVETPPDSGAIVISVPYVWLDARVQGTLGLIADKLTGFRANERQIQVRGYAFDRKGKRQTQDSLNKAFRAFAFLTTASSMVRQPISPLNISVATDAYPADGTGNKIARVELAIGPAPQSPLAWSRTP